jgi:hypothetical protein
MQRVSLIQTPCHQFRSTFSTNEARERPAPGGSLEWRRLAQTLDHFGCSHDPYRV